VAPGPDVAVLARFDADGSFDEEFGDDGVWLLDPSSYNDFGVELLPLGDGSILVVIANGAKLFLTRLTPVGELDATFGDGGWASVPFAAHGVRAVLAPDGKVVAMGLIEIPDSPYDQYDVLLARLTASGALDPSFGTAGQAVVDVEQQDRGHALAVQDDGRILVAGYSVRFGATYDDVWARGSILRVGANGELDTTFGEGGIAFLEDGDRLLDLVGVGVLADGRIVAGGDIVDPADAATSNLAAVRVLNDFVFADGFETGGLAKWTVAKEP
jgi:uncharacterized delta-60 repeat protein